MFLKLTCPYEVQDDTVTYYETQGYALRERTRIGDSVELVFSANSVDTLSRGVRGQAQGFLEFEDGTVSPLYVRRNVWAED